MKITGILFTRDMHLAVLDGRKTQTRRIAKPQPAASFEPHPDYNDVALGGTLKGKPRYGVWDGRQFIPSRYGGPGDRLYIKEGLRYSKSGFPVRYALDGLPVIRDGKPVQWQWLDETLSSMFMPALAARTFMEIVDVRFQRVQEITDEDAIAEGLERMWCSETVPETGLDASGYGYRDYADPTRTNWIIPRDSYCSLWDSINALRGHPWSANDYVFAYTFKRITQ